MKKNSKSHILKHNIGKHHNNVAQENVKIVAKNFKDNKWEQKISESLLIKDLRPITNF